MLIKKLSVFQLTMELSRINGKLTANEKYLNHIFSIFLKLVVMRKKFYRIRHDIKKQILRVSNE